MQSAINNDVLLTSDVLTTDETAALLRVSKKTLLEMAAQKRIPTRKVGREYRFHRGTVLAWLRGADVREKRIGK